MPQPGEGLCGGLVGGKVDDELLSVQFGEFERFPIPAQLAGGGVPRAQLAPGRGKVLVEAAGELGAR